MNRTMERFKDLIIDINELRKKEERMRDKFASSTGELSEVFGWIIACALRGQHGLMLNINTCTTPYAKKLEDMGFEVRENRNCFGALCGYEIYWKAIPIER